MKTTTSWALVLSALVAVGCTNGTGPTLARPNTRSIQSHQHEALGATNLQTTAQFDAPVGNSSATAPSTGTGSFTVAPSLSGGNASVGFVDSPYHYVMVGDFSGTASHFFAVVADVPFTTGTHAIDNVHFFAGVFDAASGEPTHLASTGTVTFTSVGGVGGRWVGSFSGSLDEVAPTPSCRFAADCASGESCINGSCVPNPPQCTSSAQCATGQQCLNGSCVVVGCSTNADCANGEICSVGRCVVPHPPQCTSTAQCGAGQQCVNGSCVVSTAACASNADCSRGESCVSGQCVYVAPTQCDGRQGTGSLSGHVTTVGSCAALPAGNVSLNQAAAFIDDQLRIIVVDASGAEGALLELAVCPGSVGTLSLGSGLVSAAHLSHVETADLRLLAERKASAATLTVTQVGPQLGGSFSLTIATGGLVTGTFTVQ